MQFSFMFHCVRTAIRNLCEGCKYQDDYETCLLTTWDNLIIGGPTFKTLDVLGPLVTKDLSILT